MKIKLFRKNLWAVEFFTDSDGRRVRRRISAQNRERAIELAWLIKNKEEGLGKDSIITLGSLTEKYLNLKVSGLAEDSKYITGVALGRVLKAIGNISIDDIRDEHCQSWLKSLDGYAAGSFNRERGAVMAMFNWAIKRGILKDNPLKFIEPRRGPVRESRHQPDEVWNQLKKFASEDLRLAVDLAFAGACRIGEVAALRWEAIDLEAGSLRIGGLADYATKTHNVRMGFMNQDLILKLKCRRLRLGPIVRWVFPNKLGNNHLDAHVFNARFRCARIKAGFTKDMLKFHDGRATSAKRIADESGVHVAKAALGLKTDRMILKYVGSPEEAQVRDAFIELQNGRKIAKG